MPYAVQGDPDDGDGNIDYVVISSCVIRIFTFFVMLVTPKFVTGDALV